MSGENTKRNDTVAEADAMPAEYELEHARAQPNRFAARLPQGHVVGVVLAPDVAEVFDSSESVNRFLRSAIEAMPPRRTEPTPSR